MDFFKWITTEDCITTIKYKAMLLTEIQQLRREDRLKEAYQKAQEYLTLEEPDCEVLRLYVLIGTDMAQRYIVANEFDACLSIIADFGRLVIPNEEIGVYKNIANIVRSFVLKIQEKSTPDFLLLNQLFDAVKPISLHHAGVSFSILLKSMLKLKKWSRLGEFAHWCGIENLSAEDYQPFITNQGKKVMSLAEQLSIAVAKYLLELCNEELTKAYIQQLSELYQSHTDYTYPPYFLAKLYISINQQDQAHEVLLPFVRKKSRDFWVWQLMAEIQHDKDKKVMYYAKALDCGSRKEDMLVSLYEEAADYFVQAGYYSMAKWMIEHALQIRQRNNWHISLELQYITRQAWFINTTAMRDAKFIQEQSQKAEVEALGRVQMQNKGNHKPTAQNEAVSFGGTLKRNSAGFGFVKDKIIGDVFIPQSIILNHQNGEAINGKAVKKFDKKKQQWGYAAIKIN